MALLESLGKYRNSGLLLIRIGLGVAMMMHGFPKLTGGPEFWAGLGGSMKVVKIDFFPEFWGFMAAAIETFGGFLLLLGLFTRPVCILLVINLSVAAMTHLSNGDGFNGASHALELVVVFLGLIFIGPGKYSIDKK